jgi:hypothetical protein
MVPPQIFHSTPHQSFLTKRSLQNIMTRTGLSMMSQQISRNQDISMADTGISTPDVVEMAARSAPIRMPPTRHILMMLTITLAVMTDRLVLGRRHQARYVTTSHPFPSHKGASCYSPVASLDGDRYGYTHWPTPTQSDYYTNKNHNRNNTIHN